MAGALPEGLINNKKGVPVGIEEAVGLEAEDAMKLWRIYSSGNAAIAENVGRRLENFFWRISMSERVRERLSGAHISDQFNSIRQGGYIRTTPQPSPRSSDDLGEYGIDARSTTPSKTALSGSPASSQRGPVERDDEELEDMSVTPTPGSPFQTLPEATTLPKENRRTTTTRPPPILKKLSSGSNPSFKGSSVLSPTSQQLRSSASTGNEEAVTFDDELTSTGSVDPAAEKSARRSITTRFNEEVAVSIPKASAVPRLSGSRLSGESSQRSGKRNPIVVATTGANKRRPTVMRQRSSQATSFGVSKDTPSRSSSSPNLARTEKPSHPYITKSPSQVAEDSPARRMRAATLHPSRRRQGLSPSLPSSEVNADDFGGDDAETQRSPTNPTSEFALVEDMAYVDPEISRPPVDVRVRFNPTDKTRTSNPTSVNNPLFVRKSTAAMPTAASFQASGMLGTGEGPSTPVKNRGKEAFKNEIVPLKAPASAGPEPPVEASQSLPRTKSQLSLLLEREKNRSET